MPWNDPPWHPITDAQDLKTLGKLAEELGECSAAVARCIIQGVDGLEPTTGKVNRQWLQDELADVLANIGLVTIRFDLDHEAIDARVSFKAELLAAWHNGADVDPCDAAAIADQLANPPGACQHEWSEPSRDPNYLGKRICFLCGDWQTVS